MDNEPGSLLLLLLSLVNVCVSRLPVPVAYFLFLRFSHVKIGKREKKRKEKGKDKGHYYPGEWVKKKHDSLFLSLSLIRKLVRSVLYCTPSSHPSS